jgi:hypothetical protein
MVFLRESLPHKGLHVLAFAVVLASAMTVSVAMHRVRAYSALPTTELWVSAPIQEPHGLLILSVSDDTGLSLR